MGAPSILPHLLWLLNILFTCHAYSFSSRRPPPSIFINLFGSGCSGGNCNNGKPPPPSNFFSGDPFGWGNGGDEFEPCMLLLFHCSSESLEESTEKNDLCNRVDGNSSSELDVHTTVRGGGATKTQSGKIFSSFTKRLPFIKKKDTSTDQEVILTSTTVTAVTAPKSELLPNEVITQSAERAKMIGGMLTPATLDSTAKSINDWYSSQGYVMNSVTGATLVPSKSDEGNGHVELRVREAKVSNSKDKSMVIRFVDPCHEDNEGDIKIPVQGDVDNHADHSDEEQQQYQKFRITSGRTRPLKMAKMVGIAPGSHFRIIPQRWSRIVASRGGIFQGQSGGSKSALFSTIHAVQPIPEEDGTVSVEIIASENKPFVSLEYGVTKSLYSDQWEGEFDLKHANAFGGGEIAAFNVKKGRDVKNGPTSWRMSISDDSIGDAGYDFELFSDQVGVTKDTETVTSTTKRTGATMRLRLPQMLVPRSISASFEQINRMKISETPIQSASMTMDVGPVSFLRSGLSAVLTGGVQMSGDTTNNVEAKSGKMKPYFRGTATSQKILSLFRSPFDFRDPKANVDLAVRNVASISTKHLPRHEAILLGLSSRVRGYRYSSNTSANNGGNWASFLQLNNEKVRPPIAVSNSISGCIELRLPFHPFSNADGSMNKTMNHVSSILKGNIVTFVDWAFSQAQNDLIEGKDLTEKLLRHSSMGIGYRKVTQGIPLKVDAVITEHGTGGLFFGIGRDFGH